MSSSRPAALITGSTSGIGLAIARRIAATGHPVALHGVEPEDSVSILCAEFEAETGARPPYLRVDLSQPGAGRELVAKAIDAVGPVQVLVNNAGVQKVSPVEDFPPEDWRRILSISLDSAFDTIAAALPGMYERGWGRIVNIASAHGLRASPYKSAYVATKHGLIGLTKSVALEAAEKGVTVNAICPGYVWTPLVAAQLDDQVKVHGISRDEVIRDIMLAPQPTKRFVQPEEVAELVVFLCGGLACSITGASIPIDGGWTAK